MFRAENPPASIPTSMDPTVRPDAAKNKRTTRKGTCILFGGAFYQTLAAFAKECGGRGSGRKSLWFRQQLSKHPLNDRLRFLRSESLMAIPKDVREGKVDAKYMDKLFVPADRERNTGNAGLFKLTVLE